MSETLFFVTENMPDAEQIAEPYRQRGWGIEYTSPSADDALDRIAETRPVAAVFCIDDACYAPARELAHAVLVDPRRIRPLMVFLGGSEEQVEIAKSELSVGLFVKPHELPWVLKHLAFKA